MRVVFLLLTAVCLLAPNEEATGLSFDTSSFDQTIYVGATRAAASDRGPGTSARPLATIQEAIDRALRNKRAGRSTHVLIRPGVYREAVQFGHTNHPDVAPAATAAILVEATRPGTVVVSGADVWEEWTRQNGRLVHDWPYDWGAADNPWPGQNVPTITLRREMIFVDGQRMRPVLTQAQLVGGTFYVDEAGDRVYLKLPQGVSSEKAVIETAVREVLWDQSYENRVTVRGLRFEHAATPWQEGLAAVRIIASKNVLLEDIAACQNNFVGLFVGTSEAVTLKGARLNRNGLDGWSLWKLKQFTALDSETSYNNWRGHLGGFTGWAPGNKSSSVHGMTLRRHRAVGNHSRGLWLDTDHTDVLLEDIELKDNLSDGLFLEANQGPIRIRESDILDNGGYGILNASSAQVTLTGNRIAGNEQGALHISGANQGRAMTDFETGKRLQVRSRNWTLLRNTIAGEDGRPLISTTFGRGVWNRFVRTLDSDENIWWDAGRADVFEWYTRERLTLQQWQTRTDQDRNSVFTAPAQWEQR